jgi:two-component system nitrogen regulation sensor histidine kinase GlnL
VTSEDSIGTSVHEAVLASLLEAVVAFGPDGRIHFVNPAAEQLLGRSSRTMLGRDRCEVFAASGWIVDILRRLGPSPQNIREEGELVRASDRVPVFAEATMMTEQRPGSGSGGVLVLHELGNRGMLQVQELQRRRVVELDRMAAQFAHEINNPLAGIRGAAQLLGRRLEDRQDLAEYTSMIVRQVDRLSGLVEALMALEAPLLRRQPVNIHRILNELMLLERSAAEERGIVFEPHFDPSLPDVDGDPARLEQLFLNILRNAVAHCPASLGRIRIATRMEYGVVVDRETGRVSYLTVSITDNGPGLDDEALEHLFSPLFSRRTGGHGLGLAIANAIAMAHDGRIRAANVPGGGATFHITLPLAPTSAATAKPREGGQGELP